MWWLESDCGCDCAAGGVGEGGHAQAGGAASGDLVHLSEFAAGAGQADFQAFGFAEPSGGLGFADAGREVAADLAEGGRLGGGGAQAAAAAAGGVVQSGGGLTA